VLHGRPTHGSVIVGGRPIRYLARAVCCFRRAQTKKIQVAEDRSGLRIVGVYNIAFLWNGNYLVNVCCIGRMAFACNMKQTWELGEDMGDLFNHVSLFPPFHGDDSMKGTRALGDENQSCSVLGASMLVFCMSGSPAQKPMQVSNTTMDGQGFDKQRRSVTWRPPLFHTFDHYARVSHTARCVGTAGGRSPTDRSTKGSPECRNGRGLHGIVYSLGSKWLGMKLEDDLPKWRQPKA
jgi:hypothetical protein